MVSNASEDLPEPETPVTTVRVLCGISKSMLFRLWTRAPRTMMLSFDMGPRRQPFRKVQSARYVAQNGSRTTAETFYYKWLGDSAEADLPGEVQQRKDVHPQHTHEVPVPRRHIDHDAPRLRRTMQPLGQSGIEQSQNAPGKVHRVHPRQDEEE